MTQVDQEAVNAVNEQTLKYVDYSKALLNQLSTQPPELIDFLKTNLPAYYDQVNQVIGVYNQCSPTPITCKMGCTYCCNNIVSVTAIEAMNIWYQLFTHFTEEQIEDYKKEFISRRDKMDQLQHLAVDINDLCTKYVAANLPCQFIDDEKKCSIYEARPMSCRNINVVSDPEYCSDLVKNISNLRAWRHPKITDLDLRFQTICSVIFLNDNETGFMQDKLLKYESMARDLFLPKD